MRLALHCGVPHYELLWQMLSARQMREIEIYSGIEPIGGGIGVSVPKKDVERQRPPVDVESKLDGILGAFA